MKNKTKNKDINDIEKFTVEDAIDKVKSEAMTNVILLTHMPDLSLDDKLYLAYFLGTRKGIPTALSLMMKNEEK